MVATEYDEALSAERLRESSALADVGFVLVGLVLLVVGAQSLVAVAHAVVVCIGVLRIGVLTRGVDPVRPEEARRVHRERDRRQGGVGGARPASAHCAQIGGWNRLCQSISIGP